MWRRGRRGMERGAVAANRQGTEYSYGYRRFQLRAFLESAKDEIPSETRYGFMHLALFYVLINNTVRWTLDAG
jgi:hypothetical protein